MNIPKRKFFCTFADSRMWRSLRRIRKQAEEMGAYDVIGAYDERALDSEFRERFKSRMVFGSRGFGYWVWKPQIILQIFREMREGDLLHYSDVGSWLNPKGKTRLQEYFEIVQAEESGVLAFQVKNTFGDPLLDRFSLPEYKWTKGDLFDHFSVRECGAVYNSEQIGAGNIFLKKCQRSEELLQRWAGVFNTDFTLVDDTPSRSPNFSGFVEHRHDQSVFGILCKVSGVKTLSAFEYWYPSKKNIWKPDWKKIAEYPVWAKRDIDLGFFALILSLIRKVFTKLLNYVFR